MTIRFEGGSQEPPAEVWYRYEDKTYAPFYVDYYGIECNAEPILKVRLITYEVLRTTPKGVWLCDWRKRFVLRGSHKRFACPTIEEAKESFIARKQKQIVIHQAVVRRAKKALAIIKGDLV